MIALKAIWLFLKGVPLWVYLVVALLIGVYFYGLHEKGAGRAEVKAEWDVDNLKRANAEKAAVLARVSENQGIFRQQEITNQNITKVKDDEISKVRADLSRSERMRLGTALCPRSAGQADTASASGSDGADTAGGVLSAEMDGAVKSLILEMEQAAATGRACQSFVRKNGMAPT